MKVVNRPYQSSDREQCIRIFKSNIGIYFAEEEVIDFERFLDGEVSNNHYLVFYSSSEPKQLLACGGFGEFENKTFLRWGMVNQQLHKQGIGSELLLQRLASVKQELGSVDVFIDTSQHVQGFYEKYGFSEISRIKDGFAPNIDKVRLRFRGWDQLLKRAV